MREAVLGAIEQSADKDHIANIVRIFLAAGSLSLIYGWPDDGMKQSDRHMAELAVKVIDSIHAS